MTALFACIRWLAVACAFAGTITFAQQPTAPDPPARVGALTALEGSVAVAPASETEWSEAARNRPLARGDRVWTDDGARAEVHFGPSVLHMDSRTFVEVLAIDNDVVQLQLNEGSANARVRELQGDDIFEIDTPHLAFRATQPGEWRIDVDPQGGFTRVALRSGAAVVYGAGGGVRALAAGQALAFTGRDLTTMQNLPPVGDEGLDRWAGERNRGEDQSIAARHLPRDVVGYHELDRHGTWSQDPVLGHVWYPQVAAADWAPYRYGHWERIAPWGWTWIDDAPWGFAPSHYGRWAMVGTRWCWVPGPLGPRPVYVPALVGFVGGEGFSLVAWYPLAPGEVWRPIFPASPAYVRNANRYVVTDSRGYNTGLPRFLRSDTVTAMGVEDFQRARPVQQHWTRVNPSELARAQPLAPPAQRHAQPIAPATPRMSPTAKRPQDAGVRPWGLRQLN